MGFDPTITPNATMATQGQGQQPRVTDVAGQNPNEILTSSSNNLMKDLMKTIDDVDKSASPAKGGLNMNNVEVGNNETAVQINPGSGNKGNTAMLDPSAAAIVSANPTGVDQTANDKIFYVDDDGNNVFTFVNKAKISAQAKAQAAATGTPWYDVVYITDPLTGVNSL